jgi:hypothetical protein
MYVAHCRGGNVMLFSFFFTRVSPSGLEPAALIAQSITADLDPTDLGTNNKIHYEIYFYDLLI